MARTRKEKDNPAPFAGEPEGNPAETETAPKENDMSKTESANVPAVVDQPVAEKPASMMDTAKGFVTNPKVVTAAKALVITGSLLYIAGRMLSGETTPEEEIGDGAPKAQD